MKSLLPGIIALFFFQSVLAQTNSFPLYSSGGYSGGTGDYSNTVNPQLKLSGTYGVTGYVRVIHVSQDPSVSAVYNYETGKNAYWGESSDAGKYFFRGRDVVVEKGSLAVGDIGITSGRGVFDVQKDGDIYLSSSPNGGSSQSSYFAGHIFLAPYSNSDVSYLQARRSNTTGNTELRIRTCDNGSIVEAMNINSLGNVSIGTIDAKGYRLAVNGDAIFTKVKVKTYSTWPDYVFNRTYLLRPLNEVESFIQQYQHLPEMPSAAEVEKNGLDLAGNQAALLKKIEELTLYLIQQNKELQALKAENQKLGKQQQEIDELRKMILQLSAHNK